ncbi:hypothetical protein [Christensenella hongkongensis]|uniref:hypothetical protein n=1 Tax=Christensenella hongkongensis TaxID=270498 RepID=UPI002672D9B7|nr:hypothetical protein [Christensenella hongkongensis]
MDAVWLIVILTAIIAVLSIFIYRWSKPRCVSAVITVLLGGACAVLIYYYILQYGLAMRTAAAVVIAAVLLVLIWTFLRKALVCREVGKYQKSRKTQLLDQEGHMMCLEKGKSSKKEDSGHDQTDDRAGRNGY